VKRAALILLALAGLMLTGCASSSTAQDVVAVHYKGGDWSARKFVDCQPVSDRSGYDPGDGYYGYPTRLVSFDATGGDKAESGAFTVVSKDNAEMRVPVTATFEIITDDCETLRSFHENLGGKYKAYLDDNGDSASYTGGWTDLLNFVIGKPLDAAMDRAAQNQNYRDLWNNPATKTEFEKDVAEILPDLIKRQSGGQVYFQNFQILIQKPDPVNPALKEALATEQAAIAKSNSLAAQANAEIQQANAEAAKARAQIAQSKADAAKKQAEIAGYPNVEAYLKDKCIQTEGCQPFFPTYVIPGYPGAPK
jgi:hypothetical protein